MDSSEDGTDRDYRERLSRMLAQFPPISAEARQRLVKVYVSIEEGESEVRESA
ncbi:hypothetical protein [Streptomyces sp. NPDC059009]|uniref:hypothetical protein n=1 Tax=Streptomyces sp. NPDC059009 TaxID=3346694 RepID=UPI00369888E8